MIPAMTWEVISRRAPDLESVSSTYIQPFYWNHTHISDVLVVEVHWTVNSMEQPAREAAVLMKKDRYERWTPHFCFGAHVFQLWNDGAKTVSFDLRADNS